MNKIVILNNPHDEKSRNFCSANPEVQVINFYEASPSKDFDEYMAKSLPSPCIFPSVVDTEKNYIYHNCENMQDALNDFQNKEDYALNKITYDSRHKRDLLMFEIMWKIERHNQEKMLELPTSMTEQKFMETLQYIQDLRDVTNQVGFPNTINWPEKP